MKSVHHFERKGTLLRSLQKFNWRWPKWSPSLSHFTWPDCLEKCRNSQICAKWTPKGTWKRRCVLDGPLLLYWTSNEFKLDTLHSSGGKPQRRKKKKISQLSVLEASKMCRDFIKRGQTGHKDLSAWTKSSTMQTGNTLLQSRTLPPPRFI